MSLASETIHQSVLLQEVLEGLAWTDPDQVVMDLTVGGAGHLYELLKRNPPAKEVWAFDRDEVALSKSRVRLKDFSQVKFVHSRFDAWPEFVDAAPTRVLADLGVSSFQLDDAARGFSFRREGPLDMRMDPSRGQSLQEWLQAAQEEEISQALWDFAEERRSRYYARRLVHERKTNPLATTKDLVEALGFRLDSRDRQGHHPLTRVFQGLRIQVNDEFGALKNLLKQLSERLAVGGRVAIITFHSLEDRLVKWALRDELKAINKRVIIPTEEEARTNPRSRSAKLRVYERMPPDLS